MRLERPLRGIITPMLTPLADSDRLDAGRLERLIGLRSTLSKKGCCR